MVFGVRSVLLGALGATAALSTGFAATGAEPVFRAAAAAVDIAPPKYPVIVNGYTFERTATRAVDRLSARALVLDDGRRQLAICVVDVCVIPRDLADRAKALAQAATGIPSERMLIAATHTHSAPSCLEALGSRVDPDYAAFLPGRIAAAIERAWRARVPARVGWTAVDAPAHTHCRLWIRAPGKTPLTAFNESGKRILMTPPYADPDNIGPAGAVDAGLTLLSLQTRDGRPLALLANYGMHFYGSPVLSADWCGAFARQVETRLGRADARPPFVAIVSQGTSGDQHWMDFSRPAVKGDHETYASALVEIACQAYARIEYRAWVPLNMAERRLTLGVRPIPAARLAWARDVTNKMGDRLPKTRPEVYAREQLLLAAAPPTRELKLQALCVGELGITALPCEVYGVTGLKLKAQSPLATTMNIELANGEEGYIPPPEQHSLGGYSTWEARTACLEVQAEPQIVDAVLGLLETASSRPRRKLESSLTPHSQAVQAAKPAAYWRLQEMRGPVAHDALGRFSGRYEDCIAFYLEGPERLDSRATRAPHFAGGRVIAPLPAAGPAYSLALWFWNGLPNDFRDTAGCLFAMPGRGESLLIGGKGRDAGRLVFSAGQRSLVGTRVVAPRTWRQVTIVRDARRVSVYLDGQTTPDLSGPLDAVSTGSAERLFLGGPSQGEATFEGKLCEAAFFERALTPAEAAALGRTSVGGE